MKLKPSHFFLVCLCVILSSSVLSITSKAYAGKSPIIVTVAWSPNGSTLVSGSSDGVIKLTNPATGRIITSFQAHTGQVRSIAWSPDSRNLVSTGNDTMVQVWNAATGQHIASLSAYKFDYPSNSVKWSPNGNMIASLSLQDGKVIVYSATTYDLIMRIDSGDTYDLAWSHDSTKLAFANSTMVSVVDIVSGEPLPRFEYRTLLYSIVWSPDSKELAGADASGNVPIWDYTSHQLLVILQGQTDAINSVTWSADGTKVASASQDGTVKAWSTNNWQLLNTFPSSGGPVLSVTWHPDGHMLAYADGSSTAKVVWVQATTADLSAQVTACVPLPSLANSLNVEINAQQWNTFINDVQAQPSNQINTWCADQLIQIATYLINHTTPTPPNTLTPPSANTTTATNPMRWPSKQTKTAKSNSKY